MFKYDISWTFLVPQPLFVLRPFSGFVYGKSSCSYYVLTFLPFFKTVNYTSLVCKLDISLGTILDFCTVLLLEVTWWHILKGES